MARTPLAPLSAGVLVAVLLATVVPAAGSNWTLSLAAGSKGATQAKPGPPAPTGVTDVCVSPSGRTVTVSWNAVADASTYTVFKSTTTLLVQGGGLRGHQVGERPVGRDPE
ncbi:MAG: hypothetical protein ABSF89_10660 [Acidimicrobiales bacterium]